ncbi:MAG TPA: prepilin-type N-terminal cleavage/methylation domain-containing protein [Phycisphaerae bacterium]|nr:prepilin-type N-terminal cleavage/methylation domain-containing protein [Phycisphaerae bacterium]
MRLPFRQPRSRSSSRPNRRPGGFTLFELAVVVLIIGIAAAALVAAVGGDIRSSRLSIAANVLASDIEFCQGECINRPDTPRQITFDLTNNKYSVQVKSSGTTINHPADGLPFINDFATGRNAQLSGVTLSGLKMGSGSLNVLTFDSYGRPSITADFVVTLGYNGQAMKVTVKQTTGDVSIQ